MMQCNTPKATMQARSMLSVEVWLTFVRRRSLSVAKVYATNSGLIMLSQETATPSPPSSTKDVLPGQVSEFQRLQ